MTVIALSEIKIKINGYTYLVTGDYEPYVKGDMYNNDQIECFFANDISIIKNTDPIELDTKTLYDIPVPLIDEINEACLDEIERLRNENALEFALSQV